MDILELLNNITTKHMSNKKQSSVEWLDRWFRDNPEATHKEGNKALEQAKAMHKEEIMDAWYNGFEEIRPYVDNSEQYYKETFKQD